MGWRRAIVAGLACCSCSTAAPPLLLPNNPFVTAHQIELAGKPLAYQAEAGLMPIESPEAGRLGDMSYFAYTTKAPPKRPIAFLWNGGPGSSSSALHFGAFGPHRLQDKHLIPNANTLLDVADLVFIDQMEAGYGRIAPGANRGKVLNPDGDAETFALFIETFRKTHRLEDRPLILIGESYGVQRAMKVTEKLNQRGIRPDGVVLISGYQAVGGQLSREEMGALRIPGAIALASTKKPLGAMPDSTPQQVFDYVQDWLTPYLDSFARHQPDPELSIKFADGLTRLGGATLISFVKGAIENRDDYIGNAFIMMGKEGMRALDPSLRSVSAYDARIRSDGSDWISSEIVHDIRASLGFSIERTYRGQEFDREANGVVYRVGSPQNPDSGLGDLRMLLVPVPADGMATSIDNSPARFRTGSPVVPPPLPPLMAAMPGMQVFIIGGVFDDIFPCATGHEMARRDLRDFASRALSKCYAGGHMMYFDPPVAHQLTADMKAFIAKLPQR
jgi:pimeloyl-ACP methyl ester carboxylesterase